ncbi:MAG: Lrp/AsnC ligand binding domain-containing protein [Bacteroidia bacterium]|nr:Lrp/AsnC ligand binding domain-containing protein [Bacteroidia bacterium]
MQSDSNIDKLDRAILNILMKDARTPYLEIARGCNVSGATVHLRIQKLERIGIIRGSRLIVDPSKLGVGICAYLGIYLDRGSSYKEVSEQLIKFEEVVECHYTTGVYSLFLKVYCKDTDHLRALLNEKVQGISAVQRTETLISLEQTFERQICLED